MQNVKIKEEIEILKKTIDELIKRVKKIENSKVLQGIEGAIRTETIKELADI